MKVGTENRNKTLIAAGLLVVALVLFVRMMLAPSSSVASPSRVAANIPAATGTATATENPNAATRRNTTGGRREKMLAAALKPSLDPRLRLDLLKSSEDVEYKGAGRDIFSGEPEVIPQPVVPPRKDINPQPVVNQGPPPPPPINLKFYGYATRGTGTRKSIFLSQGDTVFTAREGDIIAGRYRVVKINATSVEIQDVLSNNTQTIPLTQG
jgi:hypothetical protein